MADKIHDTDLILQQQDKLKKLLKFQTQKNAQEEQIQIQVKELEDDLHQFESENQFTQAR